jgi:hypothetical protein
LDVHFYDAKLLIVFFLVILAWYCFFSPKYSYMISGRQKKLFFDKNFLNSFFEYKMYTQNKLCLKSIYAIIKEVSEKTCFLALLKNCEKIVALLHYDNQAAAAVDYIMFNFDNFSISNFVCTVFTKKSSHVWSKNLYLFSW